MPTYTRRCPTGHEHDSFEAMSATAPRACPTCQAPSERTIVGCGGGGVLFKGSGFYATDYHRPANKRECLAKEQAKAKRERS